VGWQEKKRGDFSKFGEISWFFLSSIKVKGNEKVPASQRQRCRLEKSLNNRGLFLIG